MTRETKIGLLVGLAFIIVVGILLSEHLTTATERPAAQLADAGHSLREGVSAPGTPGMDDAAPLRAAEPQQQVPIARDLSRAASSARVSVGTPTPAQAGTQSIVIHDETTPAAPPVLTAPTAVAMDTPIITKLPTTPSAATDPFANDPIARAAAEHGEAVVPVTDIGKTTVRNAVQTTTITGTRDYKAQPGDTLSRMAALLPGGSSKANRDAIVKLNPTLQKDPNRIISGHSYLLPSDKAATTVTTAAITEVKPTTVKPATKAVVASAKPATADGQRLYVVKPGDTLSKIAENELGSKSQLAVLRKLNDDVLKGKDIIRVDMKLKLPAKTLASAS